MMTQDRWIQLMAAMELSPSIECYQSLHSAYSEQHRHYHTCAHITAMLQHFDAASDLSEYPCEVEAAIWFHDGIYKPFSSINELNSANWAKDFFSAAGYAVAGVERIFTLIMATIHNGTVTSNDEKLLVDIDLTILGTADKVYDEFERNIRKEYKFVPSVIYRKKRKELLQAFLARDSIYNTQYFQNKYEQAARANISRALKML